jgi:zinc transport system substrate-binding protein
MKSIRVRRRRSVLAFIPALLLPFLPGEGKGALKIAASVFPLYDFSRSVAGDRAEVSLLLPAGVDVHTWQPRPRDVVSLSRADLFVYIGSGLEPWADSLLKTRSRGAGRILEAGKGLAAGKGRGHDHRGDDRDDAPDPHLWLDVQMAETMIIRIRDELAALDAEGASAYRRNAAAAVQALRLLDAEFRGGLERCRNRTVVLAGHAAFGHLAARYGLTQVSLYGLSPDAEPTARHLAGVVEMMRRNKIATVFFEVNSSRRMAEVLARETGAGLVGLDPAANPSREQWAAGVTFLDIMRRNLAALRRGLGCE